MPLLTSFVSRPDNTIFTLTTTYRYETLENRLRELAFLNKGIRLTLTDMRDKNENGEPRTETFYSENGLQEFVEYLDTNRGEPII